MGAPMREREVGMVLGSGEGAEKGWTRNLTVHTSYAGRATPERSICIAIS